MLTMVWYSAPPMLFRFTHAEAVKLARGIDHRSRDGDGPCVVPLSAIECAPTSGGAQVTPEPRVPVWLLPDESAAVVPEPSLNGHDPAGAARWRPRTPARGYQLDGHADAGQQCRHRHPDRPAPYQPPGPAPQRPHRPAMRAPLPHGPWPPSPPPRRRPPRRHPPDHSLPPPPDRSVLARIRPPYEFTLEIPPPGPPLCADILRIATRRLSLSNLACLIGQLEASRNLPDPVLLPAKVAVAEYAGCRLISG